MIESAIALASFAIGSWLLSKALEHYAEALRCKLKSEQLRDRIFRDACDTIHHLRVENDALTAMLMAAQKERH